MTTRGSRAQAAVRDPIRRNGHLLVTTHNWLQSIITWVGLGTRSEPRATLSDAETMSNPIAMMRPRKPIGDDESGIYGRI